MSEPRSPDRPAAIAGARGFTLLEVLVAMVVMGIGLLGVATLQFGSLKSAQDAYVRSQAAFVAYGITDAMRANLAAARAGLYDVALDGGPSSGIKTCVGTAANCTPGELADFDLLNWKRDLSQQLVGGNGMIDSVFDPIAGAATVTVTVTWISSQGTGAGEALTVELDL